MSSSTTSNTPPVSRSGFRFGRIWDNFGMLVVFAVLFIACVLFIPNFGSFINMKGTGLAMSMSGMVACGMLFCGVRGFRPLRRLGHCLRGRHDRGGDQYERKPVAGHRRRAAAGRALRFR